MASETALNRVLYVLLLVVGYLFVGEIRRAWTRRQQSLWDDRYIDAVRSSPEKWKLGWRLEDLESRLHAQRRVADALIDARGDVESIAYAAIGHPDEYHTLECVARLGKRVHVGPDEFRDMSDRCHFFSGLDVSDAPSVGPHELFELVPLDDDAMGLRALSNGKFARVRAPPDDAAWDAPWTLEFASPLPGLAERFQLKPVPKPETADAFPSQIDDPWSTSSTTETVWAPSFKMLYSELMRGYVQCTGGGVSEPVRGFSAEAADAKLMYQFNMTRVSSKVMAKARELLAASKHAEGLRAKADALRRGQLLAKSAETGGSQGLKPGERLPLRGPSALDTGSLQIAIVVPMTSRGTDMEGVEQSPLWFNLFASFVESVDWRKNRHTFHFYLGFDQGDDLYDTGDAWQEMRYAFRAHAKKALRWLGYGNVTVSRVSDGVDGPPMLDLKLVHFADTVGAPSQAVSQMARMAVREGADYIYQLNDATILVSKDWLSTYVKALENSELAPNLGVAGPIDTTNERILTHAFVHKTHVEIFDAFFPPAFKNWWSDDWISQVYGRRATFARKDVVITHNVQSQKTGAWNRYDVDHAAQHLLHGEVEKGFVRINAWLRAREYPTMPLPTVCGYAPMMTRVYERLMRRGL